MKKIIHLSDLHIGFKDHHKRFESIVSRLIFEKQDKAEKYVIVVTGDLIDNAYQKRSYHPVKAEFDRLNKAGFHHILIAP